MKYTHTKSLFLLPRRTSLVVLQRKKKHQSPPLSSTRLSVFSSILHSYSPVVKDSQMQNQDICSESVTTLEVSQSCDTECGSTTATKILKNEGIQKIQRLTRTYSKLIYCFSSATRNSNYMEPAIRLLRSPNSITIYTYTVHVLNLSRLISYGYNNFCI